MKKLFGTLILLTILIAVIWSGTTWFLSQETENQIKQYINNNNATNNGVTIELLDYKNTSFRNAQAILKITTGSPFIDNILSNAKIITKITHGPVFLTETGLEFGVSKSVSQIDLDALDENTAIVIAELFSNKTPIIAENFIGFDQKAHYTIKISPLSQAGEANFDIDGLTLSGTQSMQNNTGTAKLAIGEMHLQDKNLELIIPSVTADLNITGFIGSQMLGSSKVSAPEIKLKPTTGDAITFDLSATSNSEQQGDEVNGTLQLQAENIVEPSHTIKQASYHANYQGLSATGLQAVSQIEAKINNLQNQLMWNADATQTPEGQEKMMSLIQQLQDTSKEMIKVIFDKVLIAQKTQFNQVIKLLGDRGNTTLDSKLIYTGNEQKTIDIDSLLLGDVSGLLNFITGTIDLNIDKAMLPDQMKMLLTMMTPEGMLKDENNKLILNASFADGKITLNGETMTPEELIAKFAPEPQANTEPSLQLPGDIQKRIEEEGLTPEIIQIIEESEDISPEIKQQLKGLQHLMNSVDAVPPKISDDGIEIPVDISEDLPNKGKHN